MDIIPYSYSQQFLNPLDLEKNHIYIKYELALIAARMKNEAFIEENEFRYIFINEKNNIDKIKFRNRGSLIIPFKEIKFDEKTIKTIHIGPSINQKQNSNSIEMLKNSLNMKFEIKKSQIPYRDW